MKEESVPIRQASFAAGAVSNLLWGRTDWSKYTSAVRTMRNWFANAAGPAMNRPGTRRLANIANGAANLGKPWRLHSFIFSNDTAYEIVIGQNTMIVYDQLGNVLSSIPTIGAAVPYLWADILKLKITQEGNALFITHKNYPPAMVLRVADNSWTYEVISYAPFQFAFTAGSAKLVAGVGYGPDGTGLGGLPYCPGHTAVVDDINFSAGDYCLNVNTMTFMARIPNVNISPPTNLGPPIDTENRYWMLSSDAAHPFRKKTWAITVLWEDTSGIEHESAVVIQFATVPVLCYTDRPVKVTAGVLTAARPANFAKVTGYVYYSGIPGALGYVGESTDVSFIDNGIEPDFTRNPPQGADPTKYTDAAGNPIFKYPTASAFFDQRFAVAGDDIKAGTVKFSAIDDILNFDTPLLERDDAAMDVTLRSEFYEDVRSMVGARSLLVLTGSGEWSVRGSQGGPLTPLSRDAKRSSAHGSSWLDPLQVGDSILFNTQLGSEIRDLQYDNVTDVFSGQDLSLFARNFFDNYSITSWAYAKTPYKLIWAVRSDGNLLGLTYSREQEVVAWHQHDSPGGIFKSVCTIPSGKEHGVFFIVERGNNVILEKFTSRVITDLRYGCFLDCSTQFDGHVTDGTAIYLNNGGAEIAAGADVSILRFGAAGGHPFATAQVGDVVVLSPDSTTSYDLTITEIVDPDTAWTTANEVIPAGTAFLAGTDDWAFAKDSFAIPYIELNGVTVGLLGDGAYLGTTEVSGAGLLELPSPAVVVQVGIPYDCDLELLSVHHPSEDVGPRQKTVIKVWVEVDNTRGLFAGPTLEKLKEWIQRRPKDSVVLAGGTQKLPLTSSTGWDTEGRISFRQSYPLPVTIAGITREVKFGGT